MHYNHSKNQIAGNAVVISIRLDLKWSDELTDTSHAKYIDTSRIILDAVSITDLTNNNYLSYMIYNLCFKCLSTIIYYCS